MGEGFLLVVLGAAVAVAAAYAYLRATRHHEETRALKSDIRAWENEGGNVPQVPTPGPAPQPGSSVPESVAKR